ncbi:c-type cytochrome [Coralloluteibacterium thermophilus]|uniref:C-type cytochrome n=1 Tax=Coralloluteibacterium thermophilum TaxID=2707049 RepID=A0ABV9NLQ3_9GAMM
MNVRIHASLTALLLAAASPAFGQGFPADIPEKAKACAQCHGATGNETLDASYPKLAGQYQDYLEKALHDYRSGARQNPQMQPFAQNLSDSDIREISAYYASQQGSLVDLSRMR